MPGRKSKQAQIQPQQAQGTATIRARPKPGLLPMFRVILHNDDVNDVAHVVESIIMLTPLRGQDAVERTIEAHHTGCALLLVTHRERAELYVEQFQSRNLTVTIEPAE